MSKSRLIPKSSRQLDDLLKSPRRAIGVEFFPLGLAVRGLFNRQLVAQAPACWTINSARPSLRARAALSEKFHFPSRLCIASWFEFSAKILISGRWPNKGGRFLIERNGGRWIAAAFSHFVFLFRSALLNPVLAIRANGRPRFIVVFFH